MKLILICALALSSLSIFATTVSCSEAGSSTSSSNWYFLAKTNKVTINFWQAYFGQSFTQDLEKLNIVISKKNHIIISDKYNLILDAKYDQVLKKYVGTFQAGFESQQATEFGVPKPMGTIVYCYQVN
jgi:hypothetical protein